MRRGRLFGGVLLVVIGALLLMDNLGYLDFLGISAWQLIGPVALISLGGWFLWASTVGKPTLETEELFIPREGAETARVTLEFGAGKLNVQGDASAEHLLAGTFEGGVEHTVKRNEGQASVHLKTSMDVILPWEWISGYQHTWTLHLNEETPLELIVKTGASQTTLDLTDLHVTALDLESGANAMEVYLPAHAGHTRVSGSNGVASLRLHVPEGVAARINTERGLATLNVNTQRFPRAGKGYESPDYATAENRVDIELEAGVSSLTIT